MTIEPLGDEYTDFERYQASVRRYQRAVRMQEFRRQLIKWSMIAAALLLLGGIAWTFVAPPQNPREWSLETRLRHLMAAPGCDAARAVGLAPAYRGFPGYWRRLDRDNDGIACEPWPRK